MKKFLKIVGFSVLGFFVLIIGIVVLINIFVPEAELEEASRRAEEERQARAKEEQTVALKQDPPAAPIETPPAPVDPPAKESVPLASLKDLLIQISTPPLPKTEFELAAEKLYRLESAKRIAKDYVANPFQANAKYKGKTIKLAGFIAELEYISGDPYVHLDTSVKPILRVSCQVKSSQVPILEKLSKEQYIYVIGRVTGPVGISVHLEDCLVAIPTSYFQRMPFEKRLDQAAHWVNAEEIAKEYSENSTAASAKYEGEIVVIRGIIRSAIDNFGRPAIILETTEGSVWCFISVEMKPTFEKKKGQDVFVVGKVKGEAFGLWYLEDSLVGKLKE